MAASKYNKMYLEIESGILDCVSSLPSDNAIIQQSELLKAGHEVLKDKNPYVYILRESKMNNQIKCQTQ